MTNEEKETARQYQILKDELAKARQNEINEERKKRNEIANREQNEQLQRNIDCMNQYRNSEGNLQLPEQFKKLSDSEIYFYHGHGGTICDEYGHPVIKVVPDNCIYISQTVCGLINVHKIDLVRAFLNKECAHIWKDPIANLDKIKEIIGTLKYDIPGIHIHLPGCTYTDTSYSCLGYHNLKELTDEEGHKLYFSGIMSLEDAHKVDSKNPYIEGVIFEPKDYLNINEVTDSFQYSFFPALEVTDQIISSNDVEDTIYLYEKEGKEGKVDINDVIVQSDTISEKIPLSKLMETYPGIHFNLLCRSVVDKSCRKEGKKAFTRRRRHSAIVQNTVYNTVDKIVKMRSLFPNKSEGVANDDALHNYLESVSKTIKADNNLEKLHDIYSTVRYYKSPKSEAYLYAIFKDLFVNQFLDLYDTLYTKTKYKNIKDIKEQIGALIRVLQMDAWSGSQTHHYKLELELLAIIAYAAILKKDVALFDYVAELGAVNENLYKIIGNDDYSNWLNAGQTIHDEAYKEEREKLNNNNNRSITSQTGGRKKNRRRKTLKKRSA